VRTPDFDVRIAFGRPRELVDFAVITGILARVTIDPILHLSSSGYSRKLAYVMHNFSVLRLLTKQPNFPASVLIADHRLVVSRRFFSAQPRLRRANSIPTCI
jgi:hypothetical protein